MPKYRFTDEDLQRAVAVSNSISEVMRVLGAGRSGSTHAHISKRIQVAGISTDHFVRNLHNFGRAQKTRRTPEDILVRRPRSGPKEHGYLLRRALLESGVPHICAACGQLPEWLGKPLVLEVDHIDGDGWNNLKENLRFICPNCHSQCEDTNRPHKNSH